MEEMPPRSTECRQRPARPTSSPSPRAIRAEKGGRSPRRQWAPGRRSTTPGARRGHHGVIDDNRLSNQSGWRECAAEGASGRKRAAARRGGERSASLRPLRYGREGIKGLIQDSVRKVQEGHASDPVRVKRWLEPIVSSVKKSVRTSWRKSPACASSRPARSRCIGSHHAMDEDH